MKNLLLLLSAIAALSSCSNDISDDMSVKNEINERKVYNNTFRVPLNDALKVADDVMKVLETKETRSSKTVLRSIKSVDYTVLKPKNNVRTRNGVSACEPDTILYMVNFEDNKGFAILGADKRVGCVYAISPEGNINVKDTIFNKGLKYALASINYSVTKTLDEYINGSETICGWPYEQGVYDVKMTPSVNVKPMLAEPVRSWWQRYPYNTYCFTKDGEQAVTGCSAIAVAQIMSYYEWPKVLNGENYDWNEMKFNWFDQDMLARFIHNLGNSNFLNIVYGKEQSAASFNNILKTFTNTGYEGVNSTSSIAINIMKLWLTSKLDPSDNTYGGPLLMIGVESTKKSEHIWVIDGFLQNDIYWRYSGIDDNWKLWGEDYPLFHCVWGWRGYSNGYFYLESENNASFSGSPFAIGDGDNGYAIDGNYNKGLKALIGFKPKK